MPAKILSIGQCSSDDYRMAPMLRRADPDADVQFAASAQEAKDLIAQTPYDLILVNRIIDADGDSGVALIAALKQQGIATPMMLISDYAEAQTEAVKNGAIPGFGKSALGLPETVRLVRAALTKSFSGTI